MDQMSEKFEKALGKDKFEDIMRETAQEFWDNEKKTLMDLEDDV